MLVSRSLAANAKAFNPDQDLGILIQMQFDEADRIFQAQGRSALAAYIQSHNRAYPGDHYYMLAGHRDLLTGADLTRLTEAANSPWKLVGVSAPVVFVVGNPARDYALVVVGRSRDLRDFLPYYLLLLCVVAALCWILTFHFASPLKRVMATVERFGAGDLSARAHLVRQDEFGALARAFDEMAARIEGLVNAERRLLQDISHELRSPLARLMLAVKLVDSGDRETARKRIHKEVRRIVDLVETVLQVSPAEGHAGIRRAGTLSLDLLIRELIEDRQIEAGARGCNLRLRLPENGGIDVCGERELLRSAMENVLRNAIHHAPPETAIEITVEPSASEVTVVVRDYGPAVPEEHLRDIFKPFFRVDESRSPVTGGTGLGLAIAKRGLLAHKGEIWAENAGPGLRVYMKLPLAPRVEVLSSAKESFHQPAHYRNNIGEEPAADREFVAGYG